MKKYLLLFLLILCTGCSNESTNILNVLNWSSYIPNEIITDFEKSTNIKVNYSTYSSNEELLAKLSSVKEGTYDLIFPSDYMIEIMINKNMLQLIDKTKLNNLKNLNSKYLNLKYDINNDYSIPFIAATTLISVNTDNIKEEINSYNDLINPKYKNQIVLLDDQRIIIGMALLANGYDMNSVDKNELEVAENWLRKLKNNIKAYDSDSPKNFLISEEANIALLWNAEGALAQNEKSSIKNIFPKEGFALSIDNFAIPKSAENVENAYIFIDYILKEDVMAKIIESYPYKNINKETQKLLSSKYLNNSACNINDELLENAFFVDNIGNNIKEYDKIWAKIK